jgi:hypothetical protein
MQRLGTHSAVPRRLVRPLSVAVLTALAITIVVAPVILNGLGWVGTYGLTVGYDDRVHDVIPGGPASQAGIRNGDRAIFTPTPFNRFFYYNIGSNIGSAGRQSWMLETERNGRVTRSALVSVPNGYTSADALSDFTVVAVGIAFIMLGAFLLLRAPSVVTWAFFFVALSVATLDYDTMPWVAVIAYRAWFALISMAALWGAAVLATRFPNAGPTRTGVRFERAMLIVGIVYATLYGLVSYVKVAYPSAVANEFRPYWSVALPLVFFGAPIVSIIVLLARLLRSAGETRKRLQWVILGFVFLGLAQLVAYISYMWLTPEQQNLITPLELLKIALPASVAYAVLRHRVIDARIVVGRSIVYGALASVLILLFTLVETGLDRLLAATHLVFVVEFGLVLAIAFSVRLLHRRLEFVATQMFYKDRLDGQARLARATAALHHAESRETIAELLIAEALEALKLSSAALFVHKGDHFERESSLGWEDEDASEISDSDPVVGHLRTRCGALDLTKIHWTHAKLPFNSLKPLIAEPIIAHDRVMAFTLYGGREAGDAFASEELQSLDALADAAAASYDHIRSKELEAQNAALLAQQLRLRNELARIKAPKRPL